MGQDRRQRMKLVENENEDTVKVSKGIISTSVTSRKSIKIQ